MNTHDKLGAHACQFAWHACAHARMRTRMRAGTHARTFGFNIIVAEQSSMVAEQCGITVVAEHVAPRTSVISLNSVMGCCDVMCGCVCLFICVFVSLRVVV